MHRRGIFHRFCLLCMIASGVYAVIIFNMIVLSRPVRTREIILIPFYSIYEAKSQPELYREMLMNVFMFEPLGMVVPFGLTWLSSQKNRMSKSIAGQNRFEVMKYSILFCLCFSMLIELCQGIFGLGRAEIDDIIMNLSGSFIGIICCVLAKYIAEIPVSQIINN